MVARAVGALHELAQFFPQSIIQDGEMFDIHNLSSHRWMALMAGDGSGVASGGRGVRGPGPPHGRVAIVGGRDEVFHNDLCGLARQYSLDAVEVRENELKDSQILDEDQHSNEPKLRNLLNFKHCWRPARRRAVPPIIVEDFPRVVGGRGCGDSYETLASCVQEESGQH